ncbi:Uncharacterized protein TCM_037520 [Theobroma cacao]|uniref:Reverse transcriptase zinc-binding domain-containing protein n=1 Tax=Theobroma cacao TaxID=3641 RepID=A0A061GL53_THECC|nr:Uncharacterized protein TCM_037520 [Theobroma cacao]
MGISMLVNGSPMQNFSMQRRLRRYEDILLPEIRGGEEYEKGVKNFPSHVSCKCDVLLSTYLGLLFKANLKSGSREKEIVCGGGWPNFGFFIGNGKCIIFWDDVWVEETSLKELYLRMYAFAKNKKRMVREFKEWVNGSWEWRVELRRQVLGWEEEQYRRFLISIGEYFPCQELGDELVWKGNASGIYTTKSFCQVIRAGGGSKEKLVHGKAVVKAELAKRGMIRVVDVMCLLCKIELEMVDHLFMGLTTFSDKGTKRLIAWQMEACADIKIYWKSIMKTEMSRMKN